MERPRSASEFPGSRRKNRLRKRVVNKTFAYKIEAMLRLVILLLLAVPLAALELDQAVRVVEGFHFRAVGMAVEDLARSFGTEYPRGEEYLRRLRELESAKAPVMRSGDSGRITELAEDLEALRYEALLANPLLDFDQVLLVRRAWQAPPVKPPQGKGFAPSPFWSSYGWKLAIPVNHTSLASVEPNGWDNEIAILSPVRPDGKLTTVYRPKDSEYVGEIDLHWDAHRLLFSSSPGGRYRVFEMDVGGNGLRQVTPDDQTDVDNFDASYLPDGKIIFAGNASYQAVPCWNGLQTVSCLFSINADGSGMRQLTFDQDENSHPAVLNTGQVVYQRWDYTNTPHVFPHLLFQMNPDGTGQREFYGSNSYWPNAIYFPRPIPGEATKIAGIVAGYHGDHRMGELFIIDPARGRSGREGMVAKITGRGRDFESPIMDHATAASWPKFLYPWPLSDKYFLVSMKPSPQRPFGIYLVDVFDNLLLLKEIEGQALLEPIPLKKTTKPPIVPEKVNLAKKDGTVYLHDVHAGPGLDGVPRGTVKRLRVFAYHFGYRGLAGWDKIGIDGPWEVMRILGTVPVEEDGSAMFNAPANTPISVQPLDGKGRALQVMRSWFTLMPGEVRSCVGCHEPQNTLPAVRSTIAATGQAAKIHPFYGPARGFDFARDLQRPVLDKYCVGCHNGSPGKPDLRGEEHFPDYEGKLTNVPGWWNDVDRNVYDAKLMRARKRINTPIKMTPAYEALHPYTRRYGLEGDYVLSNTAEYHASTSELVQMIEKGHHGVELDREAWERIHTWIDLNVPGHGTWSDALDIPFNGRQRRLELAALYAGGMQDPEETPPVPAKAKPIMPSPEPNCCDPVTVPGWPFDLAEASARQRAAGEPIEKVVDLGGGQSLKLMLIPAGEYAMGDRDGTPDEQPIHRVRIEEPFWVAATEITNAQFALFDPEHDSRYINVLHMNTEERGFPVNKPEQPAVRMTWTRANEFCEWLSRKTGLVFRLPTEEQWEWAARAGTDTPFHYGFEKTKFEQWENLADRSIKGFYEEALWRVDNRSLRNDQVDWMLRVNAVNDRQQVSAPPGTYHANPWGLYDIHGNVAEWTRSEYISYRDGSPIGSRGRMVVRGGSWNDRPHRARSGFRWGYPKWQPVYNVGIRVMAEVK